MALHVVDPWNDARWDAYVASHPRATVYHTSQWIRIVCEIGRYPSLCLLHEHDGKVTGVLPLVAVESRLTGNRVSTLPFSDVCFALTDDAGTARALTAEARAMRAKRGAAFYEMRGLPALRDGSDATAEGFVASGHFYNYVLPLQADEEALLRSFSKKSVRYMINKGERGPLSFRRGDTADVAAFYRLYVRTRRRHGVPPQPERLFSMVIGQLAGAALHLAEYEGTPVAAAITASYNGTTYLKYEVSDERHRELTPIHALLWKSIQDAIRAGDHTYDFGRTAGDNTGLNQFKQRWGTTQVELPYYFDPPAAGMSVVKSDSLKYRIFTRVFRTMPEAWTVRVGERIFRHFG
ncbi:MAG TPA: GNAT family N-acetyltransferase [Candidatus Krumholzibacteria bacterium]|nr:GNAT family N-acetyltransferase [Candidatus Krumholzibacteria bacterium]